MFHHGCCLQTLLSIFIAQLSRQGQLRGMDVQQRFHHFSAAAIALLRIFGQRPFNNRFVRSGESFQLRLGGQVLSGELCSRFAGKRQNAGEHFLINDGQAVLITAAAGASIEDFGGSINGSQPPHQRCGRILDVLDQAEVRHLDSPPDQQQVLGFHVQMLQAMLRIHVIQGVGSISQVLQ